MNKPQTAPEETRVDSCGALFAELAKFQQDTHQWVFRGQKADWQLESTLERVANRWEIDTRQNLEDALLRDFQRAFPTSSQDARPEADDYLGWLALMQHHGAPTRLLDWTYSPFVATYFALEQQLEAQTKGVEPTKGAVWALQTDALSSETLPARIRNAIDTFDNERDGNSFKRAFVNSKSELVRCVNPYRLNERLVVQQGLFLCPGNLKQTLQDQLMATLTRNQAERSAVQKFTFTCDENFLRQGFATLLRMNISAATLFPGLDGYARSLRTRARHLYDLRLPRK